MDELPNGRSRRPTRRALLGGLATGGAGALAGCSALLGTGSTSTLRIGTLRPPVTLDPIAARSIGSEQVIAAVVCTVEAAYFERETLSEGIRGVEKRL